MCKLDSRPRLTGQADVRTMPEGGRTRFEDSVTPISLAANLVYSFQAERQI